MIVKIGDSDDADRQREAVRTTTTRALSHFRRRSTAAASRDRVSHCNEFAIYVISLCLFVFKKLVFDNELRELRQKCAAFRSGDRENPRAQRIDIGASLSAKQAFNTVRTSGYR